MIAVKKQDRINYVLLMHAIRYNDTEEVKELIATKGVKLLDLQDEETRVTPLIEAIRQHRTAMATLLIESGADINLQDKTGTTPVMAAIQEFEKEITQLLITKNAKLYLLDSTGMTAIGWAFYLHSDSLSLLINAFQNSVKYKSQLIDILTKNTNPQTH